MANQAGGLWLHQGQPGPSSGEALEAEAREAKGGEGSAKSSILKVYYVRQNWHHLMIYGESNDVGLILTFLTILLFVARPMQTTGRGWAAPLVEENTRQCGGSFCSLTEQPPDCWWSLSQVWLFPVFKDHLEKNLNPKNNTNTKVKGWSTKIIKHISFLIWSPLNSATWCPCPLLACLASLCY